MKNQIILHLFSIQIESPLFAVFEFMVEKIILSLVSNSFIGSVLCKC